ncbi:MAG: Fe2+-dependent dioxygenase [Pseudomonadota bacterium]
MLMTIAEILSQKDLATAQELCTLVAWRDGAETAGKTAREVKRNQQADLTSRMGVKLRDLLQQALTKNPVFQAAAQPKQMSKLLVSRTEAGGGYGLHVDNAFMPVRDGQMRTDLSFTLFLSAPETYEGGELVIEHSGQTISAKPGAGDLILYPSTSLHQVQTVTAGTRLVCVGWIESQIPRADDREALFDLTNLKAELAKDHDPQSPIMLTLSKTLANLKRRFN